VHYYKACFRAPAHGCIVYTQICPSL